MHNTLFLNTAVAIMLLTGSWSAVAGDMPSREEMWKIIQQQQRQIDSLMEDQKETDEKVEAVVEIAEQSQQTASSAASWAENTQVGGYGEMHYNNLDVKGDGSKKEIDFHRFVLFFGHQFSDRLRWFSELELEHAVSSSDSDGAVELEQAYIEYDLNAYNTLSGGMLLVPVGILNETHEPPTFYGVERNPIETNIIPTTWSAGGAALSGEITQGWGYDFAIHEGLNNDDYIIRKGRQKNSNADARDLASTARVKWTGIAGIELATAVQYQQNITQGVDDDASAWLFETHANIRRGPYGLRALYAQWRIGGKADLTGRDEQTGFYIEPSYKISPKFGLFARYNQWDNQAGNSSDSEKKQVNMGVNYWPHPDVVLKADVQQQDNEDSTGEEKGFNLGLGYQF